MKLWYKSPSENWNEALPIGNGRLGAMVFGKVKDEIVQLNEDSIWYGNKRDRNNKNAISNLSRIRKLIFDGEIAEAEKLATFALSGVPESQRQYQTMGDLNLSFDFNNEDIKNYKRSLNIEKAILEVEFEHEEVNYKRTYFSSYPAQLIVIHLEADKKGRISFNANLRRSRYIDEVFSLDANKIGMSVCCGGDGSVCFSTIVQAINKGGSVFTIGENICIENADEVTLLISSETSYYHKNYKDKCIERLMGYSNDSYITLKREHIADYSSLFNRVQLFIKDEKSICLKALDTKARLKRIQKGEQDEEIACLLFQYGRYLLISSSRPNSLPANLQGIWNKDFLPPWDSKYTININTQMNYWISENCNLSECHKPLFDHIERMRVNGRKTAKEMYGCRGFMVHHNTDLWADTAPQDIYIPATYWVMGGAWLCLHLFDHYEYTCDLSFLELAYEVMKEAAMFLVDYLIEDENGYLVTCPSVSPENSYRLEDGQEVCLCASPTMDIQIINELFTKCIRASEILSKDGEFSLKLEEIMTKLPPIKVGKHGQLQEWMEDYDEVELGHRHLSHLFGVFPGTLITSNSNKELFIAASKSIDRRLENGGGHTGWSIAWVINLWARLKESKKAYEALYGLLRNSTHYNMLNVHPPFQIDGNFGGASGIVEMLLQSHDGVIELLPSLPKNWKTGSFSGLCARGGFEIELKWEEYIITYCKIKSRATKECNIVVKQNFVVKSEGDIVKSKYDGLILSFFAKQNKEYSLFCI